MTAGYGVIGYLDDYLKIRTKNSKGLPARYKLLGQFLVAGAVLAYVFTAKEHLPAGLAGRSATASRSRSSRSPSTRSRCRSALYIAFAVLVVVAMSNAVNLTDGLDGLAIGPVIFNAGHVPHLGVPLGRDLRHRRTSRSASSSRSTSTSRTSRARASSPIFCGAMVGAGIGFLWYNTYPAQVFMGDVGALALGGGLGTLRRVHEERAALDHPRRRLLPRGASASSRRSSSFKLTGKRVFLMAPIHHHYEKKGWPEPKIIVRFWIISILLALVSLASLKLR